MGRPTAPLRAHENDLFGKHKFVSAIFPGNWAALTETVALVGKSDAFDYISYELSDSYRKLGSGILNTWVTQEEHWSRCWWAVERQGREKDSPKWKGQNQLYTWRRL